MNTQQFEEHVVEVGVTIVMEQTYKRKTRLKNTKTVSKPFIIMFRYSLLPFDLQANMINM